MRGHADGIIIHGPDLLGAYVIYPLIWEHKALKATSYREIERDGLEKRHSNYLVQVALYQAYLNITNPALFTVTNADTCEWVQFFVRSFRSSSSEGAIAPPHHRDVRRSLDGARATVLLQSRARSTSTRSIDQCHRRHGEPDNAADV